MNWITRLLPADLRRPSRPPLPRTSFGDRTGTACQSCRTTYAECRVSSCCANCRDYGRFNMHGEDGGMS